MTDHTQSTHSVLDDTDDLELITRMLNGQLDPERVEAVRKRLEEDPAFRDMAAPLLLTWTIPKHLERHPRPEGEWEEGWSALTSRPGFRPEPPRRKRSSWSGWLTVIVLALVITAIIASGGPRTAQQFYTLVPQDTGWITLWDGIEAKLSPGAALEKASALVNWSRSVRLDGEARFRITTLDLPSRVLRYGVLRIDTQTGQVSAGDGEFTVSSRNDTTFVRVDPLDPQRQASEPTRSTVSVATLLESTWYHLPLQAGEGAIMVFRQQPKRIPSPR